MARKGALGGFALGLLLGVAACDDDAEVGPTAGALSPEAMLVRASLDVRGVRPTRAELDAVVADPASLDATIDAFVDDPRFGDRVRSMFAPAFRTRRDIVAFSAEELGLPEEDNGKLQRAFGEEVLNILHHVAVTDRPWTEILTTDTTIVDPMLIDLWPLEELPDPESGLPAGTVMARYTDGRPTAGVLSTNAFHWRHTSTLENGNRGRSNAITRALLCEDFLERPIDFPTDVDLTDSESIHDAIRTNDGCTACHATLDPFASHLWGFMQLADEPDVWRVYRPENELLWKTNTEAQPAYFGVPTSGTLSALASSIAADERFVSCTVRTVYEGLLGREATLDDEGQLAAHREVFLGSGLSLKTLVRDVLRDPAYRGEEVLSAFGGRPVPVTVKLASPELLESSLADLSGYRLTITGRALTEVDIGLRALAGGSERGPSPVPSLGRALVHRRLAEGSARALTLAPRDSRVGSLLGDLSARPSPDTVVQLVREIRSKTLAADDPNVLALLSLWDDVAASDSPTEAWSALLTALMADPEMAVY